MPETRDSDYIRLQVRLRSSPPSTVQWIDRRVGLAYICVPTYLKAFADFLDGVDRLLSDPGWRPGMPVIEDLRECEWVPPATSAEEWRSYLTERQTLLDGCHWAVVSPYKVAAGVSLLDAATKDAAQRGVVLQQFTRMSDAHLWLEGAGVLARPEP